MSQAARDFIGGFYMGFSLSAAAIWIFSGPLHSPTVAVLLALTFLSGVFWVRHD